MKATITPGKVTQHTIEIPPSKSLAHRAIICAALSEGESTISNVDYSVDIRATIDGLRHLGAEIIENENSLIVRGNKHLRYDGCPINCQESGSTLRFFLPLFSLTGERVVLQGSERLMERPQSVYEALFQEQHISFERYKDQIVLDGRLKPGNITLKGNVSSQFITGLLFALPLLDEDSLIHIEPPFESRSYVNLTLQMLRTFGVHISYTDDYTLNIQGKQSYHSCDVRIEGDYSQLVFFASLGLINQTTEVFGLSPDSLQGDKQTLSILAKMNGRIQALPDRYRFHKSDLHGTTIDLKDCPDLGPMLFALATQAEGTTTFINTERLRIKESDRILAMEQELTKLGCQITSSSNSVTVTGISKIHGGVELCGHNDHRIVMALSVLSTLADSEVTITDAQAIRKSYPGFFRDLQSLGVAVSLSDTQ